MKTTTKVIVGLVLVGAGVAGYFAWKKFGATPPPPATFMPKFQLMKGLGAFKDGGFADYNTHVAARYWKRQHEMYNERLQLAALRGY